MEQQRTRSEDYELDATLTANPYSQDDAEAGGLVTVTHGPYAEQLPVAGESVGRIRSMYADMFDLDPASQAVIDGREVDDDTILQAGQLLVFVRHAGEKGTTQRNEGAARRT